ncbi:hypothetical protein LIER_23227 [Lithospermum erythrorhizon]|uniref:Uncharacterized protein n=1 Tax=Lithospermum erythrorhizon TaxID=34254 RepID=A0AAV3R0C4_LITER
MADEVLAHLADGQAFNFSFLPALHHGMECYFEKVRGVLKVVSQADYRRAFHLPLSKEALHEAETRIVDARDHLAETVLQLARDEASLGALNSTSVPTADIEAVRLYEGEGTTTNAFLNGLELVRGNLEDMVPEHHP